jgi:glycosyltransferase involved in cell wall biosynthesis
MGYPVKISVVICTYNRAKTLGVAVESVAVQSLPESLAWEIVVVDNNSPDQTRQVVEALQRKYPEHIRYVLERQQGISHARNAGIMAARGEILAFLDDDETATADWLLNLTANLHTGEWAGAGGRVLPPASFSPPSWISIRSSFVSGPLAAFDLGLEPGELKEPAFGANMAFRREVFDKYGGFRTDLGRMGKSMISNEDTELGRRVMAAGLRLRYEPSALTYHPVEETRLKKQYFLDWWFHKGRSDVRELGNPRGSTLILGIPLRLFRAFPWAMVRWMVSLEPSPRFGRKIEVWNCAGQIIESYQRRHDARQKGLEPDVESWPSVKGSG